MLALAMLAACAIIDAEVVALRAELFFGNRVGPYPAVPEALRVHWLQAQRKSLHGAWG